MKYRIVNVGRLYTVEWKSFFILKWEPLNDGKPFKSLSKAAEYINSLLLFDYKYGGKDIEIKRIINYKIKTNKRKSLKELNEIQNKRNS